MNTGNDVCSMTVFKNVHYNEQNLIFFHFVHCSQQIFFYFCAKIILWYGTDFKT